MKKYDSGVKQKIAKYHRVCKEALALLCVEYEGGTGKIKFEDAMIVISHLKDAIAKTEV